MEPCRIIAEGKLLMDIYDRFMKAIASDQAMWSLREEIRQLLTEGHDRAVLLSQLEAFRGQLRLAGRDADEDTVLEVMDFLTGWCSPDMQL